MVFSWCKYPFVLGSDVAGEVVEVGSEIKRFAPGDRVVGYASSTDPGRNNNAEGAFQLYAVLIDNMTSPIPDDMSFEKASVMPMGVTTAACALFSKEFLGLRPTGKDRISEQHETDGKDVVLVWGGSTSIGCNAIQPAVAAGYRVITTCSPKNHSLVKSLGATHALDYRSPGAACDIVAVVGKSRVAGALAIGHKSGPKCMDVMSQREGNKFVAMVSYPTPENPDASTVATAVAFVGGNISMGLKSLRTGVKQSFVFASSIIHNEVSKAIWEEFLPKALHEGRYVAAPEPQVGGTGLESIQSGLDQLKKGVSAKKLVVSV